MIQKYCKFIPCIHVSLQCRSLFGSISCLYFPLNVYCHDLLLINERYKRYMIIVEVIYFF